MNLPIKFPSDAEVIAEEAARFRALSPRARVQTLGEMYHLSRIIHSLIGVQGKLGEPVCRGAGGSRGAHHPLSPKDFALGGLHPDATAGPVSWAQRC